VQETREPRRVDPGGRVRDRPVGLGVLRVYGDRLGRDDQVPGRGDEVLGLGLDGRDELRVRGLGGRGLGRLDERDHDLRDTPCRVPRRGTERQIGLGQRLGRIADHRRQGTVADREIGGVGHGISVVSCAVRRGR